jgi:hypothetical protein
MNTLKFLLFLFALSIVSCSNETYEEEEEEDIDVTDLAGPENYVPNTLSDYWIYEIETTQGFELSDSIILQSQKSGGTDLTTSAQAVGVEELNSYSVN